MRAGAYSQGTRLIWEFLGKSNRYPLPCCIYTRIRTEFQSKSYHGFEDEDSDDEGEVTDSEQSSEKGT